MSDASYRSWFERYAERFDQERKEMVAQGFTLNEEALQQERRVEFRGQSKADSGTTLVVQYPDAFPSMPPRVFLGPGSVGPQRHYNRNSSEVCLFGPGQPRWRASLPGTTAIAEADQILKLFFPGKTPPHDDLVPEPASSAQTYAIDAAFIVPPGVSTPSIGNRGAKIRGQFRFRFDDKTLSGVPNDFHGRGVVLETRWQGQISKAEEFFRQTYVKGGQEIIGTLVYLPQSPPPIRNVEGLQQWLNAIGEKREKWMGFVFPEESGTAVQRRLAWLVLNTTPHNVHLIRTFVLRPDEREARIPGTTGLAGKKVVIIGCGSIGSKMAVALAATGVDSFTLVDPDFIEPHNAVRHEIGVDGFGILKVRAVANRIFSINPWAAERDKWQGLGSVIGGINDAKQEESLWNHIAQAQLVVETTGVHGVSRYVNDVCFELGIPALIVSVTNGAWSGEIVRVIPGETACWQCWHDRFPEPPPAAPTPPAGVFAPGCDQPTFTGTSYDVGIVANLATWVAVETLLRDDHTRKAFRGDYFRWIGRAESGDPKATCEVLTVDRRAGCAFCNS